MNEAAHLPSQVRWRAHVMQVFMSAERLWSALWPSAGFLGLVLILSLFDIWGFLSPILHLIVLAGLMTAAAWNLFKQSPRISWPSMYDALRRLEVENGLKHRPLTAYVDELSIGTQDTETIRLWATYRAMLRRHFASLRVGAPKSDLAARDPYAFRMLTVLVLGTGLAFAGADASQLIRAGLMPDFSDGAKDNGHVDAWLTPPDYTGHAPIFLTDEEAILHVADGGTDTVTVPQNSQLTIRISGAAAPPEVSGPLEEIEVDEIAPGTWSLTALVTKSGTVLVSTPQSANLIWEFDVVQDLVPEVAFAPDPFPTPLGLVGLPYVVEDDYGVTDVEAQLSLVPLRDETGSFADGFFDELGNPRDDALFSAASRNITELALPAARPQSIEDDPTLDWREHPWAGREVLLQLRAQDDAGGSGYTRPRRISLPQRTFLNPLAAALAEQRITLAQTADASLDVAITLDALTDRADLFMEDTMAYLGIRTAVWTLANNPRADDLQNTFDLLWDLALRLEDGDLSLALDRIRELEQALLDALSRGADQGEIAELLAQLREAIAEYLAAMEQTEAQPSTADASEMMQTQDLDTLLDRIEEMAMTGSMQAAREMLQGLSDLLARMENATPSQGGEGMSPEEQAMAQALEGLSGILGSQRQLLDETFRGAQGESGGPYSQDDPWAEWGGWPPPENWPYGHNTPDDAPISPGGSEPRGIDELAESQWQLMGSLRGILEELLEGGVDVPGPMGDAQREMDESGSALGSGSMSDAVPPQELAVEALRQALDALSEQLLAQMSERMGGQEPGSSSGQDPLGRQSQTEGPDFGDSVNVPTEREMQRAREILEQLRRRAGERDRPEIELDYLERLLRRF